MEAQPSPESPRPSAGGGGSGPDAMGGLQSGAGSPAAAGALGGRAAAVDGCTGSWGGFVHKPRLPPPSQPRRAPAALSQCALAPPSRLACATRPASSPPLRPPRGFCRGLTQHDDGGGVLFGGPHHDRLGGSGREGRGCGGGSHQQSPGPSRLRGAGGQLRAERAVVRGGAARAAARTDVRCPAAGQCGALALSCCGSSSPAGTAAAWLKPGRCRR
jgi:hypothetical protein